MKDYQRIVFSSTFDSTDAIYTLKMQSKDGKGKSVDYETKHAVTKFYDEYGYLHRYVVRDLVEEAIQGFIRMR
jgi:hypothetical protein